MAHGRSDRGLNVLSPAPVGMLVATNVSKYVNIVKHDDPACVARRSDTLLAA